MKIDLLNNYHLCPLKADYDIKNRKATKNFYDYYLEVCHKIVGHYFTSYNPGEKQLTINRLYKRFDKYLQTFNASPEVVQAFKQCSKTLIKALDSHMEMNSLSILAPTTFTKEYTIGESLEFTIDGISKKLIKNTTLVFYDFYLSHPFLASDKTPLANSLMLNAIKDVILNQSIFEKEDLARSRFVIIDPMQPKLTSIYFTKLKLNIRYDLIEQLLAGISLKLFYPRPDPQLCSACFYRNSCDYSLYTN